MARSGGLKPQCIIYVSLFSLHFEPPQVYFLPEEAVTLKSRAQQLKLDFRVFQLAFDFADPESGLIRDLLGKSKPGSNSCSVMELLSSISDLEKCRFLPRRMVLIVEELIDDEFFDCLQNLKSKTQKLS